MERDCNRCVYSTRDGNCRKWTCEGTKTVKDIRADALDEVWKLSKEQSVVDAMGIRCIDLSVLDLILEQLKEQNNG